MLRQRAGRNDRSRVRDHARTRKEAIRGVGRHDISLLRRSIYDGTEPHILVDIEELVEPEGTLLLVHVPKGMPPHTTSDGVARIRIGKDCKPLTGRPSHSSWPPGVSRIRPPRLSPGSPSRTWIQLKSEKLRTVIRREAQNEELARMSADALIAAIGLTSDEGITLAGLLLVGKRQSSGARFRQHEVIFLR